MTDQNKPDKHANDNFWESVEQIAKNIINVIKDTLDLVKGKKEKSP